MSMKLLKRNQFIPFLDLNKDSSYTNNIWSRIDLSTIFELTAGEEEEDYDYICYESAVTEIKKNKPELPQEIALYEGNTMFDFIHNELFNLPTGAECKVPALLCFGGSNQLAWRAMVTISSKVMNTVDGKISFSMKFGGDIEKGTYTITDGIPVFVPSASATVTLAGTNVTWTDIKGNSVTSFDGVPGAFVLAKATASSGNTIKEITDSNGKEYVIRADGFIVIQTGSAMTVTATTKTVTAASVKSEKKQSK